MGVNKLETRNGTLLYTSETLVYEDNGWGIISDNRTHPESYATHHCPPGDSAAEYGAFCWSEGDEAQICEYCKQPVPDNIITLIRINNWQR